MESESRDTIWVPILSAPSDGGRCPETHPFAYNEGRDCCAAPFEDMNDALGRACDGSPIGLESRCCLNAYKVSKFTI